MSLNAPDSTDAHLSDADNTADATWTIGGQTLKSRLMIGSARYPSPDSMQRAIAASQAEILTVSLRRENPDVRAGQAAGIRTAAVLYGYRDEEELRATGPDECWPRFGHATA